MSNKRLSPAYLIKLQEILAWMVLDSRIDRLEAIDVLSKAGLTKNSDGTWTDEEGAIYTLPTDI